MNLAQLRSRVSALLLATIVVVALIGCASAGGSGKPGSGGAGGGGSGDGGSSDGASGSGGSGTSSDITGHWQLVSGTDATGSITPGTAKVTFTFNGASSGGRGPCNSFGATAHGTTTGAITIVVGIHTNMACVEPDLNTTESRYFAALDHVTTAALEGDTLTLTGDGDSLVFTRVTP